MFGLGRVRWVSTSVSSRGSVGAEVEEHHGVPVLDRADRLAGLVDADDGFDEFVGLAAGIALPQNRQHVRRRLAYPLDQCIVGELDALPAVVAVHGVVAARHRRDGRARTGDVIADARQVVRAAVGGRCRARR